MPFPMTLARFNRRVTNRVARRVAGRISPLANLEHRGRTSGTTYRTPVVVFREGEDGFVIALTYGPGADWVRNVLASDGCTIESGGRRGRRPPACGRSCRSCARGAGGWRGEGCGRRTGARPGSSPVG